PFMEQQPLYNQMVNAPFGTTGPNKLTSGPANVSIPTGTGTATKSVFLAQVDTFKCPSFPGADESKGTVLLPASGKMAVGNYVALSSTHYNADGSGTGTDGTTTGLYDSAPGGKLKQLAGNGVLAFWQDASPTVAPLPANTFTKVNGSSQA